MSKDFFTQAKLMIKFVREWSGGSEGQVLSELEAYERMLPVKRKLLASDLHQLSKLLPTLQKYVPAMAKAMLNSPQDWVDVNSGASTLFQSTDYTSLQVGGKNHKFALDANEMMESAWSFLVAYAQVPAHAQTKILADFEIRCVMHVHQKNATLGKSGSH